MIFFFLAHTQTHAHLLILFFLIPHTHIQNSIPVSVPLFLSLNKHTQTHTHTHTHTQTHTHTHTVVAILLPPLTVHLGLVPVAAGCRQMVDGPHWPCSWVWCDPARWDLAWGGSHTFSRPRSQEPAQGPPTSMA